MGINGLKPDKDAASTKTNTVVAAPLKYDKAVPLNPDTVAGSLKPDMVACWFFTT